ncbi:MAG: N-acetyl-beta-hexosaminidase [Firmicutes bacterium]|nr:N-acetyl-beta-hexosaminidase [Bacillota bacterium]
MQSAKPVLYPVPRQVAWGSGDVAIPAELVIVVTALQQELLPAVSRFREAVARELGISVRLAASAVGLADVPHVRVSPDSSDVAHAQGYTLAVGAGQIRIAAQTAEGAAHGLATLKQLLLGAGRRVPEVTISDWPDFARRGLMLDISRGKVPTMATLYRFIDLLADLKLNEFQLYMEHTFAYREHPEVWQNGSPMTGEEILLLNRYCRERFIDLVPNQNSFGHLTPWLVHDRYKHMAEAPDGWTAWGLQYREPFSLCPLEPAVIPFVAGLYDELLPHFSSAYFNVGCDETFDVGQGRSKAAVAEHGEQRIYVDHLLKIYEQVKARGKTMMFWGDIIVKAPAYIAELPKDVIALEWGYEADHPFDVRCGHFAAAGIPFYVCPGASNWNTLTGRTDNAVGNLLGAAEAGLRHGAIGYLNTIWGDRGHQDYQPVSYLPIAYGAGVSWALEANREADVVPFLDQRVFMDRSGQIGAVMRDLGNVYQSVGKLVFNGSLLGHLIQQGPAIRPHLMEGATAEGFDRGAAVIREIAARLDSVQLGCEDAALVLGELRNAVRMLLHACSLGNFLLGREAGGEAGSSVDKAAVAALALDLDAIMAEHRLLWLARNRIGGLEEMSLAPLRRVYAGYKELLA